MNSSEKGHSFEREIAKKLSLWWSEGKDRDIFYRSDSSGSRATLRERYSGDKLLDQYGDIVAEKIEGRPLTDRFCIECKHYKNINLWALVTKAKTSFLSFHEQNIRDSNRCNKIPLTIVRQNFKPIICFTTLDYSLSIFNRIFNIPVIFSHDLSLGILKFEDFLKININDFKDFLQSSNVIGVLSC